MDEAIGHYTHAVVLPISWSTSIVSRGGSRHREKPDGKADGPVQGIKIMQKFASAHTSILNRFNNDRHLNSRETFKQYRSAALAELRQLAA